MAVDPDHDVVIGRRHGEVQRVRRAPGRVLDDRDPRVLPGDPTRDAEGVVAPGPDGQHELELPRVALAVIASTASPRCFSSLSRGMMTLMAGAWCTGASAPRARERAVGRRLPLSP